MTGILYFKPDAQMVKSRKKSRKRNRNLEDNNMLEFKYDTQLLIEGENLDEDKISEYFTNNFASITNLMG